MALKPCPFSGSENLEEKDGVVVCNDNGVMGPKPADGETAEDAWNKRASDAAAEEPADEPTEEEQADAAEPDEEKDPEAAAQKLDTLAKAKDAFKRKASTAKELRAKLKASRAAARGIAADMKAARASAKQAIADRDTAKASLAQMTARAEKAEAHIDADVKKVNAEVARTLAATGHAPLKTGVDTGANANAKPDLSQLTGLAKVTASIAAKKLSK